MTNMQILFDPHFAYMDELFKGVELFSRIKKRYNILKCAQDKLQGELNVVNLLKRVRMSNDLWLNVLKRDQVKIMRL